MYVLFIFLQIQGESLVDTYFENIRNRRYLWNYVVEIFFFLDKEMEA